MAISMEVVIGGVSNIFKAVQGTNQLKNNMNDIRKSSSGSGLSLDSAFKKAEKFTSIDNIFGSLTKKFDSFSEKQQVFSKIGGKAGMFSQQLINVGSSMGKMTGVTNGLGTAMQMFGGSMKGALVSGQGLFAGLKAGFATVSSGISSGVVSVGGLTASFAALGTAVLSALGPIALVAAAVFTLKKVWDLNLGGIQTKFNAIMGQLKVAWAKFNIIFIKTLRKFEPLFSFIFGSIFKKVAGIFSMIGDIFKGLYIIIEPVIDAFAELFSVFGKGNKGFSVFGSIAKVVGKVFLGLAKVLAVVIKVGLIPFKIIIGILKATWKNFSDSMAKSPVIGFLLKVKDAFLKMFTVVKDTISRVWAKVVATVDKIPDLFLPKSLESIKTKNQPTKEAPGVQASNSGRGSGNNVNNNQSITFNTSTPTSPDQTRAFAQKMQQQLASGF